MARAAAPHPQEEMRLSVLQAYEILDTGFAEAFDRLTRMAAALLAMPIAAVSLVDARRQWFKSVIGLKVRETPREVAFCAHAILGSEMLVVEDAARDPRFADNPLVTGDPFIRFYAGVPIRSREGLPLGTLCVIDTRPRRLDARERRILEDLAAMVTDELELHRNVAELQHTETALRGAVQRLQTLAGTDALTGLANRRTFDAELARELRRAARRHAPVSAIMTDLDNFKSYNDRFGHPEGDICLRAVAGALKAAERRPADLAARYGGEEFVLLLPETSGDGVLHVAETLRKRIMALGLPHPANAAGVVTASFGVATLIPRSGEDPCALIRAADAALYRAKAAGRNRCVAAPALRLAAVA